MKILILGITGMLGHILFEQFMKDDVIDVYGTARSTEPLQGWVRDEGRHRVIPDIDADRPGGIESTVTSVEPDMVINCIGIIKQLPIANDPIPSISINSLLPHRIARVCKSVRSRMIHISTDCVFDGKRGGYSDEEPFSAEDLYGRTKSLGEVGYEDHCITIRTSIIGHELKTGYGLVDWFLGQSGKVRGFTNAVYTGFPTIEMVRIIRDFIIPDYSISGIYNVSSEPISKYELLTIVADEYGKDIEIESYDDFKIDRSLNSERFRSRTGYKPPDWRHMIRKMHEHYVASECYR
ncbi:MAG: SDR family oxidoreductase [Syntrophorhabdaceae bacterium]|nr:SDR family oxidoreductase [Syntrophorhabdaceae bacterium]